MKHLMINALSNFRNNHPFKYIRALTEIFRNEMGKIPRRRQYTDELQESSNSAFEDLRRFIRQLTNKGSFIYVFLFTKTKKNT